MKLLVVTPTLGKRKSILRTIESVIQVIDSDCSHVVVGPADHLKWICELYPHIIIVDDYGSKGIYEALNLALSQLGSRYEYFAYINDDDYWLHSFSHLIDHIKHDQTFSMIAGRVFLFKSPPGKYYRSSFFPFSFAFPILYKIGCPFLTQQAIIFRVSDVISLGGFDPKYPISADSEMISSIITSNGTVKLVNECVACYDISECDRLSTSIGLISIDKSASSEQSLAHIVIGKLFLLMFRLYNLPLYLRRHLGRKSLEIVGNGF